MEQRDGVRSICKIAALVYLRMSSSNRKVLTEIAGVANSFVVDAASEAKRGGGATMRRMKHARSHDFNDRLRK